MRSNSHPAWNDLVNGVHAFMSHHRSGSPLNAKSPFFSPLGDIANRLADISVAEKAARNQYVSPSATDVLMDAMWPENK